MRRVGLRAQVEARLETPAEVAATTLGKHDAASTQLVAGLESGLVRAVARDAEVAGHDARDAAVLDQHFRGREARQHVDAERLGLSAEPDAEIAEGEHAVAVVAQQPRHERRGHGEARLRRAEPIEALARDRDAERRAAFRVIGKQLRERARIEHGARDDVRADGRALFDDADGRLAPLRARELAEPARGGESGRARADDHDVELQDLARHEVRTCGRTRSGAAL